MRRVTGSIQLSVAICFGSDCPLLLPSDVDAASREQAFTAIFGAMQQQLLASQTSTGAFSVIAAAVPATATASGSGTTSPDRGRGVNRAVRHRRHASISGTASNVSQSQRSSSGGHVRAQSAPARQRDRSLHRNYHDTSIHYDRPTTATAASNDSGGTASRARPQPLDALDDSTSAVTTKAATAAKSIDVAEANAAADGAAANATSAGDSPRSPLFVRRRPVTTASKTASARLKRLTAGLNGGAGSPTSNMYLQQQVRLRGFITGMVL